MLDAAAIDEVVDVKAPERRLQQRVDIGDRYPLGPGGGRVDIDVQLLRVVLAVIADAGQQRVVIGGGQQLLLRGQQGVVPGAGRVLDFQVEARGVAEFTHRRRHGRNDLSVVDLGEGALRPVDDGEDLHIVGRAQLEVLHAADDHALVFALAGEVVAGDGEDVLHRLVLGVDILHLFQHGAGLGGRRADG